MEISSVDEAREIARAFYEEQIASYRSPPPIPDGALEYEMGHQEVMADDCIAKFESQVQARSFERDVTLPAEHAATVRGFQMPAPGTEAFRALCEGIARAQIEQARFALFRQADGLSIYQPQDALFAAPVRQGSTHGVGLQSIALEQSLSLGEAIKRYVAAQTDGIEKGAAAWKPKTLEEKKRTFQMLEAIWGSETFVTELTASHVRGARDFMKGQRPRAELDTIHPNSMLAKKGEQTLHPGTASKYFSYVKSLLIWLESEAHIDTVPGRSLRLSVPPTTGERPVRPWSVDELNRIFCSPLFAGFKTRTRRHLPGKMRAQDGIYWMMVLGLYAGARAGELLQITVRDVHLVDPVPYLDLPANLDLKTVSSARQIPIHPDLFEFGFDAFVEGRQNHPERRLFHELGLGAEGHRTGSVSKKLNNYLRRIGVKESRKTVFHSFRHCFVDATRNAEMPENLSKQLIGHKDSSTTGGYGAGANLATLHKQVMALDFGLSEETRVVLRGTVG